LQSCPFYTYQPGWSTPYGQQTLAHLVVGATTGAFAPTDIEEAYYAMWKNGGNATKNGYYFDKSTKEFVANEEAGQKWPNCGGQDSQADAIVHMIPVVALLAGNTPLMLSTVDTVIRVTQVRTLHLIMGACSTCEFAIEYQ
jgi:hypothetical protein